MRRKKATDAPLPVASVDTDDRVKVVERREYVQRIPNSPPPDKPPIDIAAAPVEEEQGDELLDFLAELEEEIGLSLRVDRLPQYTANGKWNKGAAFEFCDNIPVNKSDLKSGQYMAMIRDLFGPAAYRCTLREVGAGIIRSWPIKIAAPMQPPSQPRSNGSNIIYQQQASGEPPVTRDTLQELLDAGEKMGKLKKIFGWDQQAPQPVAQPTVATVEREPLQDRIIGAALDAVMKEKPADAADILRAYINPPSDSFSWKEIIGEVVKPLLPVVMNLVGAYMANAQRQAQAQQPTQPQQAQLPAMAPPVFVQQPQPPAQAAMLAIQNMATGDLSSIPMGTEPPPGWMIVTATMPAMEIPHNGQPAPALQPQPMLQNQPVEDEDEMAETDLIETLAEMLDDCVRRSVSDPRVIEAGRQKLVEFKTKFPALDRLIGMLVTMPPQAVLGFLAMQYEELTPLVTNPIAIQVITDLQAAIKPEPVQ